MILPQGKKRFSMTLPMFGYALLDVVGMVAFAVGLAHLAGKGPLFFNNFPSTTGEAVLSAIAGLGLMLWSAAKILGETLKQVPEKDSTDQP